MLDTQLHLVDGVVILLAAAILSIFILIHAVYCWLDYFGFDFLSDGVFEPLSAAALLFFGIYYYGVAKEKDGIKRMVATWTPISFIPLMDSFNNFAFGSLEYICMVSD